jgi:hypothetical protein
MTWAMQEERGEMEDTEDGEPPWAYAPETRASYEAALGRFILAFNDLDDLVTKVMALVLSKLGRDDLFERCVERDFAHKLFVLDLLKTSTEGTGIADAPVELLRTLAGERNVLAHGYFDENPMDGSYEIVGKKMKARRFPLERLNGLFEQARLAREKLRFCEAFYHFDPVSLESEET